MIRDITTQATMTIKGHRYTYAPYVEKYAHTFITLLLKHLEVGFVLDI